MNLTVMNLTVMNLTVLVVDLTACDGSDCACRALSGVAYAVSVESPTTLVAEMTVCSRSADTEVCS